MAAHREPGRYLYVPAMCLAAAAADRPQLAEHRAGAVIRPCLSFLPSANPVKWEASSGDRWRRFRIVADGDVDACPHCAVLTAVETLGTALPLDDLRIARTCSEYQSVLNEWLLPCASFGRSPAVDTPLGRIPLMLPDPGWMAECHVGKGNPQTPAACAIALAIADGFYATLTAAESPGTPPALALHAAVRRVRVAHPAAPVLWAPYIHVGA